MVEDHLTEDPSASEQLGHVAVEAVTPAQQYNVWPTLSDSLDQLLLVTEIVGDVRHFNV